MRNFAEEAEAILNDAVFKAAKSSGLIPDRHSYAHNAQVKAATEHLVQRINNSDELRDALKALVEVAEHNIEQMEEEVSEVER